MYDSRVIANYFIGLSFEEGIELTPMKLIKLVFISHGWYSGQFGKELISDAVQAWKYGPVIPVLYRALKHYGNAPIDSYIDINGDFIIGPREKNVSNKEDREFLMSIWNHYKSFSAFQLSTITHATDTPWHKVFNSNDTHVLIPNHLIKEYYSKRIKDGNPV